MGKQVATVVGLATLFAMLFFVGMWLDAKMIQLYEWLGWL